MPLSPGQRLGPYEIDSAIGAGGMGEVYEARDTRLGRTVAIKALSDAFARAPDRVARFQREAQILATLNHPNIAGIYGLEEVGQAQYLALEFIDGESLANRLAKGAVPLPEALGIARQVMEALEVAHEKGIIHRDLKPGNIMLTRDGDAKVLDFGLARFTDADAPSGPSNFSTLTAVKTQAGVSLGTPAYMAPEQVTGRPADRRGDVWALGAVLFELLSGERAFAGADVSDTLTKVMTGEPDWRLLPATVPPGVVAVLRRCLEKDRKARIPEIAAVRYLLEEAVAAKPSEEAARAPARVAVTWSVWHRVVPWSVAAAMTVVAAAVWWSGRAAKDSSPAPVRRFVLPITQTLVPNPAGYLFALSPDGRHLIYKAREGDDTARLFVRALDQDLSKPIANTENAGDFAVSPDSRWIAFKSTGPKWALMKVPIEGGLPVLLAPLPGPQYGTGWGLDQSIVLAAPGTPGILLGSLWRVPAAGGKAEPIVDPDATKTERGYNAPEVLPDGSILFVIRRADSLAVAVLPHGRPPAKMLIEGAREPHYVAPGYLVFARVATLMAVPFDLQHLAAKGTPVPVLEGVRVGGEGASAFRLSADGTLVYLAGAVRPLPQRVLMLVDRRTARDTAWPFKSDAYSAARFSPDGHAVAVGIQGRDGEQTTTALWLGDLTRNTLTSLTNDGSRFAWTQDGKHIIFQPSNGGLAWRTRDLSGAQQTLAGPEQVGGMFEGQPASSSDGNTLVFAAVRAHATGSDLWMAHGVSGSSNTPSFKVDPFLEAPANQGAPVFSPDGRWVAYHTDGPGAGIYVQPFPGPGSVAQVAPGAGPIRWIGKELFFVRAQQVMAVPMTTSPSLDIGAPRAVLTLPAGATFADVTSDGQQVLLLKTVSEPAPELPPHEFRVIINFVEEMKRKVAAGQ